jgi:hypothetical protein
MSKSKRSKVWNHDKGWWVRTGTSNELKAEDVTGKSTVEAWGNKSKEEKQQVAAEAYFWVISQKKVERKTVKGKKVSKVTDKADEGKRYVTYVIKRISESGCGKDEAQKLWKTVSAILTKELKKEFVALGDKPPKVERKVGISKKTKTIAEQIDMWRKSR